MRMPGETLRDSIVRFVNRTSYPDPQTEGTEKIVKLLATFMPDPDAQEALFEVLIDYVFNVTLAIARSSLDGQASGHPDNVCQNNLVRAYRLDEGWETDLTHVAMAAAREANRPRQPSTSSTLFNDDYCYLCGVDFDDYKGPTTVDHVWPKRAGGTGQRRNLWRTHDRCETPKWDLVGSGDVESLRFAFRNSDSALLFLKESPSIDWLDTHEDKGNLLQFLRKLRMARLRIGVAARQRFKCKDCKGSFLGTVRGFRIVRLESELPWALTNTFAVCLDCYTKRHDNEERLLRAPSSATETGKD